MIHKRTFRQRAEEFREYGWRSQRVKHPALVHMFDAPRYGPAEPKGKRHRCVPMLAWQCRQVGYL